MTYPECQVQISELAEIDLDEIYNYIAEANPVAADKRVDELMEKFRLLTANPDIGIGRPEYIVHLRSFPFKQ